MARLTPHAMVANLGSALLVVWTFLPDPPPGLWVWLAASCTYCTLALTAWWRRRASVEVASRRALRRSTVHAMGLSGLWGAMALIWFPGARWASR